MTRKVLSTLTTFVIYHLIERLARKHSGSILFAGPWSCQEDGFTHFIVLDRLETVKEAMVIGRRAEREYPSTKGIDDTRL